jgi:hypothetical protein
MNQRILTLWVHTFVVVIAGLLAIIGAMFSLRALLAFTNFPAWLDFMIAVPTVFGIGCAIGCLAWYIGTAAEHIRFVTRNQLARNKHWDDYKPAGTKEKWENIIP